MKLNTVDNINKVRGVSLFPRGQFVCNELWGDRRGYRVQVCWEILMQPEGVVSHRMLLSIQTGIIGSKTAAWLNHSH